MLGSLSQPKLLCSLSPEKLAVRNTIFPCLAEIRLTPNAAFYYSVAMQKLSTLASQDGPNNQPELSHLPLMLFCHR